MKTEQKEIRYFGAKVEDILKMLSRIVDGSDYQTIRDSLEGTKLSSEEIVEYLESQSLSFQSWLFKSIEYKGFEIDKLIMDSERVWEMRIEIISPIREVARNYRICFHYNPRPKIKRIKSLIEEIKELQSNPTLLAEEDKRKIQSRQKTIHEIEQELKKEQKMCPELSFDARVKESKFPTGTVKIHARIPSFVVQKIIENEWIFTHYAIRLEEILK